MRVEQTQLVKAPREKVFGAWIDYEAWPKWQTFFINVRVVSRDGSTALLDTDVNFMGRNVKRAEKHLLTPPEQIRVEGEMAGIANTTLWKFEPVPEGTRVVAEAEFRLPLRLKILGPLAKRRIQGLAREVLQDFADYVEKL